MERIAIISDIHGNLTALEAVLKDIENRQINTIICLGDLVIKNSNSDIVIDLIREKCSIVLKGNCDDVVSSRCTREEHVWNRNKIGKDRVEYLKSLPVATQFYISGHLVRLFHSSPYGLEDIFNIAFSKTNTRTVLEMFDNTEFIKQIHKGLEPDIIVYGHIHTSNMFRYGNKQIISAGSVGVPVEMINENPEDSKNKITTVASYLIIEGEYGSKELSSISMQTIRVPYDIEKEIKEIEESDLPTKKEAIFALKTGIYFKR